MSAEDSELLLNPQPVGGAADPEYAQDFVSPSGGWNIQRPWRLRRTTGAIVLSAGAALVVLLMIAMGGGSVLGNPVSPLLAGSVGDAAQLSGVFHSTEFGLVSHELRVSGFDCPGDYNKDLNGVYAYQGNTGEGRAVWAQAGGKGSIYYDPECDGAKGEADDKWGQWMLHWGKIQDVHMSREEHFSEEKGCDAAAHVFVDKGVGSKFPDDLDEAPGPIPPERHMWKVYCGGEVGWTYAELIVAPTAVAPTTAAPPPRSSGEVAQTPRVFHPTEFGLVSHELRVSGLDCPGGFNKGLNGVYAYQGNTGEGRAFWAQAGSKESIYYDPECDGAKGGADNQYGIWMFQAGNIQDVLHMSREEHFRDEKGCDNAARVLVEKGVGSKFPNELDEAPGPIPPERHMWIVYCGTEVGWTYQDLIVVPTAVAPTAASLPHSSGEVAQPPGRFAVRGEWQFLKLCTPGQTITMKSGKSAKTANGLDWGLQNGDKMSAGGSTGAELGGSVEIGGSVGIPFVEGGEAKAETHASAHLEAHADVTSEVTKTMKDTWTSAMTSSKEETNKFTVPEGHLALWQYVIQVDAKTDSAEVLTASYVFAKSGTSVDKPKCYPNGCTDAECQDCVLGWELA